MKQIFIIVNDLSFLVSHRVPIAIAARQAGYGVNVVYGTIDNACKDDLEEQDFELHYVPIQRGGLNPLADLRSMVLLWYLFVRLKPDLVHLVSIKPVLYGGIAARLAGVPAVASAITGLGYLFLEKKNLLILLLRGIIKHLFHWSLRHTNQKLIFQNADNCDRVLSMARLPLAKVKLIRGSGINLADCPMLTESNQTPIVAMASRLLRDKGVREFVDAARLLHERGVPARFWLIGAPDLANPSSVTFQEIETWINEGIVECFGHRPDVLSLYAQAHIITLPSYGEGLPKSLIEAAACGRAVVTTDVPGCRDAIEPNVSGLLVPPRDIIALADAIQSLIEDPIRRKRMGAAGRILAEREFGIEKIVAAHLQVYRELLESCGS